MKNSRIAPFLVGAITACVFSAMLLAFVAGFGLLPVQADVAPSSLETALFGSVLHASVVRQAPGILPPHTSSDTDQTEGAAIYRQLCSRCHGLKEQSDNSYGKSFFPPAPNLSLRGTSFTEGEVFWITKHGIRNTAMPSWSNFLSDEDIWKVAAAVRNFNSSQEY